MMEFLAVCTHFIYSIYSQKVWLSHKKMGDLVKTEKKNSNFTFSINCNVNNQKLTCSFTIF